MDDWRSAFAEDWDAVVLGTGMKECLLSGLLSVAGKKVLHLDRNSYYGGASASLDIHQLFDKFAEQVDGAGPDEASLGKLREYGVDLVPKFIMAGGQLVKVLIHTGVANYMEFKPVDGSFVYSKKVAKVCKVPAKPEDAMKSSLMGMMEKTRMAQLALFVSKCKLADRATWKAGMVTKTQLGLDTMPSEAFFKYWSLEKETIEFLTHSVRATHPSRAGRYMEGISCLAHLPGLPLHDRRVEDAARHQHRQEDAGTPRALRLLPRLPHAHLARAPPHAARPHSRPAHAHCQAHAHCAHPHTPPAASRCHPARCARACILSR